MSFIRGRDTGFTGLVRKSGIETGLLLNFVSIPIGLAIWEYAGRELWPIMLAPPTEVFAAWIDLVLSGRLPNALVHSFEHMLLGYFIAVATAIPLGILLGRSTYVRWALSPFVDAIYATPSVAYIPLIIVWFGLQFKARVFIVFIMCFFEILIDTQQGIRSMNQNYLDVGTSFDMSWFDTQRKILLPASLPYVFTGLRLGIGRAVRAMIVAEIFLAIVNLGAILENAGVRFQTDVQLAVVVTISVIGVVMQGIVTGTERVVIPWNFIEEEVE